MGNESSIWPAYYEASSGRGTRPLFVQALERFGPPGEQPRHAIDLGAGDGAETEALLRDGWAVLAIDAEPESKNRLQQRIPPELRGNLRVETLAFEHIEALPSADFIYSVGSLSFCRPEAFPRLWGAITASITPGGRIACDLFGDHDTWANRPHMTFFTRSEAAALFDNFEIEQFDEMDEDGQSFSGSKHWHAFSVIARKPVELRAL